MTPTTLPQPGLLPAPLRSPVRPGSPSERAEMEAIQKWVGKPAYLEGCVGDAPPGWAELAHVLLGVAGLLFGLFTAWVGVLVTGAAAASATARLAGWPGFDHLVAHRPTWNVRVGVAGPQSRFVIAAAADRARPRRAAGQAVAIVLTLVALVAASDPWLPRFAHPLPALLVLGVTAAVLVRRLGNGGAPTEGGETVAGGTVAEARAVGAAVASLHRAAGLGRTDVTGVVAGAGAVAAAGPLGFLDWWAVDRRHCVVLWVDGGAPDALQRGGPVDRLRKVGWQVEVIPIGAGEEEGSAIDRVWSAGSPGAPAPVGLS